MKTQPASNRLTTLLIGGAVAFAGATVLARQATPQIASPTMPPAVQGQPPAAPGQPGAPQGQGPSTGSGQGGRGGGRGRGGAPIAAYSNYTGFTKLWDGATFTNWEGEMDVWSIVDGTLHADTTKTPGQHHIHYKGPGAMMKDFDLKVEFKISAMGANGGIQYRSRLLHPAHGGTIQDPLGKPLPVGITTMAQAVAAGITSEPQRGAGPGGGGGGRGRGGDPGAGAPGPAGGITGGNPAAGTPAVAAAPAAPAPTGPCTAGGFGGGGGGGRGRAAGEPGTAPAAPAVPTGNPWQISGYQFDLDSNNGFTGQLYEGQGRGIVTAPGTMVELLPGRLSACIGVITENPAQWVKPHQGKDGEWQQVEIIARGNTLIHMINGHVMSVTVDDNPEMRAFQGILSLQLEGSGQIWYRNVYVKPLDSAMVFPEVKR